MRLIAVLGAVLAASSVASTQVPSKIDAVALARTALDQLTRSEFAALAATFDEKMTAALPTEKLAATWAGAQSQFGALRRAGEPRLATKGEYQIVVIPVEFERANLDMQFVVDAKGRVAGLAFRPPTVTTPFSDAPYVTPSAFTERQLTVDAGGWPLPATLTLPNGPGPFAAVVLVHGSGPQDRDVTIGPNKPFRDLALGLASRGVAVLRYVKRTREHGPKIAALPQFTVKEETIDDAVAAVRLLKTDKRVAPGRVFVLGHSLGAMVAPRIAMAARSDLAGVVMMAAAARSLPQLLIEQTRYLAQADGTIGPDEQKTIEQLEQLAARVAAMKPGDPAPSIPGISAPASYWIDLRDADPLRAAREVSLPMLVLQGGRDYQATTDDFEKWRASLGGRKNVTLKLYPSLNHLFMAGTGRSLPQEYLTSGHVEQEVVNDIATWILPPAKP